MKAYSYLRFSTPEQSQGDSFRRQTALAESYALQHGLELDTDLRFSDLGVSAFRGKNADTGALRQFQRAIEDGDIDPDCYLLVESLDRLSRNVVTEAQSLFLGIVSQGVTLVTLTDSKVYSKAAIDANPVDLIMSLLVMIRAHEESQTKSRRIKQAWVGRRAKATAYASGQSPLEGRLLTSQVPGWLRAEDGKLTVIEDRAAVVHRIFSLTLEGQGKETIVRALNAEGVPPFGKALHWSAGYVHKILGNPAVIGTLSTNTLEHTDGKPSRQPHSTIEGYYPAVVDPEVFARVQALRATTTKPKGKLPVQNMLAGLAVCPLCGSRMTRVTKGRPTPKKTVHPYLVCSKAKLGAGCQYRTVRLDGVEAAIRESYGDIADALSAYGFEGLAGDLGALEASELAGIGLIEQVTDELLAIGRSPALTRRLRALETELEATQKAIREKRSLLGTRGTAARLGDLKKALAGGAAATVNTALRELFASVTVDYQSGDLDMRAHNGAVCRVPYSYQWVDA